MYSGSLGHISDVKRFLVNGMQMSVAVSLGFLLSPVLLSVRYALVHFLHR
jgi:hypothetical protein